MRNMKNRKNNSQPPYSLCLLGDKTDTKMHQREICREYRTISTVGLLSTIQIPDQSVVWIPIVHCHAYEISSFVVER